METIKIIQLDPERHQYLIPSIIDLQIDCVQTDAALVRFLPPFPESKREKMHSFWESHLAQVTAGGRIIFVALVASDGRGEDLGGLVELALPDAETGPFRGDVEMLMVSSGHRRKRLGNRLMDALEELARDSGRTMLTLSSEEGSVAEAHFYPRLGYTRFGTIPKYGISPKDGSLRGISYFYKDLTSSSTT
ncbi:Acetyltransferase [Cladobotryum mycophilum]|uniref:Acetyltransferase n=1 Tax=Cladobotryum mycophilum TaxID=491253 RepID=A0ABR0SAM5_9HYPO